MGKETSKANDKKLRNIKFRNRLGNLIPKIMIAPTFTVSLVCVYGFILWTIWISFTSSKILPKYDFVGFEQYNILFTQEPRWWVASLNLFIFSGLFIAICIALGLTLAIFIDQRLRGEGVFRTIYLYPMALSFIVTGTAWRWIMNPSLGLERLVQQLGFSDFTFRLLVESNVAIYAVVIAAVWQSTGFMFALFIAGLRGIDNSIIKAAQIDGASLKKIYLRIIIPSLRPVFLSAVIILLHLSIKCFDLVMALTSGGPGYSTDMPATFMYAFAFNRGRLAFGAASAVIMFITVMAIIIPYLYTELKGTRNAR
ncbi:MAG: sugar ABC transporter permease [Spirochaetales bacterium]|nr:sugar ABC transporter permease [Spirochaetales bacterium]